MCKRLLSPKAFLLAPMLLLGSSLMAQEIPTLFPEPLSPRIANYNIDVKLNPDKRLLDGSEVLIWHNKTQDTITELRFHMYLNAFRNSESTFMRESGGLSRGHKIDKDGWGFSDVNRLTVAYGADVGSGIESIHPSDAPDVMGNATDLKDRMQYIQPDDGNEHDKTVFRVPLPKPLPPGEFVAVNIDFTAKLPSPPFARTGAKKEYFFVAQWFPKIGVYEEDGWNCHQFHANSEFFADFGVYNVRMTVPEENVVGATGVEVDVRNNGDGTATHFYHAEDVHDFVWTTSPEYLEFTGKAQDVDLRLLIQPDHANQSQRHLDAARVAVQYFQDWYGDYPFPNLTVVDPRRGAGGSGGMEYPTLITAGTRYGLPEGLRTVEAVIVHEFGHNYWYHLLASNEFEEAWLDEGINSYTDTRVMNAEYDYVIDLFGIKINQTQVSRAGYIFHPDVDPIMTKSWEFYSRNSYGINSYSKPAIVLNTLRNYLGPETMRNVMQTYVERWRFKHPTSEDFFAVVEDVSGQELDWFFDQAFRTTAVLDYSVTSVISRKIKPGKGFDFTVSSGKEDTTMTDGEVEPPEAESMISTDADTDSVQVEEPTMYYSRVKVRRLGDFKFPVEIEFVFENGDTLLKNWDGQDYWRAFEFRRPEKLIYATVDPDNEIPLDVNFTNNSRSVEKQTLGVNKLSARWMFWMQFLLEQPEVLNFVPTIGEIF